MAEEPPTNVRRLDFGRRGLAPTPSDSHTSEMSDSDSPTRSEIDAKIAASEARTDTKFAELLGEIKVTNAGIVGLRSEFSDMRGYARSSHHTTIGTIVATGLGIVAIVIALLTYGATWFGLGINAHDVARQAADQALREFVAKAPLNH
jgi:hypothetical protein